MSATAERAKVIVRNDPWADSGLCLALGWQLAVQQLRVRYRGSVLGYVWTMVYPLLLLLTYALVFSSLFGAHTYAGSPLASFSAVFFAWLFISSTMNDAVYSVSQSSALLHQTHFPLWLLPFSTTLANLISFFLSLPVVMAILLSVHVLPGWHLLLVIPLSLLLFCFTFGLSLLISLLSVFFRDMPHIIGIAVTMLFFLSPVFYTMDYIHGQALLHAIVVGNPISYFLEIARTCFLGSGTPLWIWGGCMAWSLGTLGVGVVSFSRFSSDLGMRV